MEEAGAAIKKPKQLSEEMRDFKEILIDICTTEMLLSPPEYSCYRDLAAKMIDCGGGCRISIIEEGNGPLVPEGAEVHIHYTAFYEFETEPFDSSLTKNMGARMKVHLGTGELPSGLETALGMVRGPAAHLMALLTPTTSKGKRSPIKASLYLVMLYRVMEPVNETCNDPPMEEAKKDKDPFDLFYTHSTNFENKDGVALKRLIISEELKRAMCYCDLNQTLEIIQNLVFFNAVDRQFRTLVYFGKASPAYYNIEKARECYNNTLAIQPRTQIIKEKLAILQAYLKKAEDEGKKMWQHAYEVTPRNKSYCFDLDKNFKDTAWAMCRDLADINQDIMFDLPTGLTGDEKDCIRMLINEFEGLVLIEDTTGGRNKLSVVSSKM